MVQFGEHLRHMVRDALEQGKNLLHRNDDQAPAPDDVRSRRYRQMIQMSAELEDERATGESPVLNALISDLIEHRR